MKKAEALNKQRLIFWPGPEKPKDQNDVKEICSLHFTSKYFRINENGEKKFVRDGSKPTVFPIIISSNEIE